MINSELKKIKDKYGEKMMHLCRELFPTLLDNEGLLFNILSSNFAYSKFLYEDIIANNKVDEFEYFIYSNAKYLYELANTTKTPYELLKTKGYTLYECKTEEDINKYKKYYTKKELLCTFDTGKLKNYYVFFIVKDNALDLKREDFINPLREDEYGTSVLSIQFRKSSIHNAVSIKNRYNHTVPNPDATYYNNLDNIVPGLTKSFEVTYNLNISNEKEILFSMPYYLLANDGRYYRYNSKIGATYYCPNNIVINNNNVLNIYSHSEKYILMDYFIIDLEHKKITPYDNSINDGFIKTLDNITKIDVYKDKDIKYIYITLKENIIIIGINKYNEIILYQDTYSINLPDNFLIYNYKLEEIYLPNVKIIGSNFLATNRCLNKISAPNVYKIGTYFLFSNEIITDKDIPLLKYRKKIK